jgi:hypothetical protein
MQRAVSARKKIPAGDRQQVAARNEVPDGNVVSTVDRERGAASVEEHG